MSDRPSRGTSWSSNCFQTSSAFGFLFFIVRSRVGIRGVESFTGKRKDKDLTQRTQRPEHGDHRKERSWQRALVGAQHAAPSLASRQKLGDDLGRSGPEISRENAVQKEKGRNRGRAADSPENYYTKTKTLCKSYFQEILGSLGRVTRTMPRPCYAARTSLN